MALARKYHPDTNGLRSSGAIMKALNEAYAVLAAPDSRSAYDWDRRKKRENQTSSQYYSTGTQYEQAEQARKEAEYRADLAEQARKEAEHRTALAERARQQAEHRADLAERARKLAEHRADLAEQAQQQTARESAVLEQEQQTAKRMASADLIELQFKIIALATERRRFVVLSIALIAIGLVLRFLVFPVSPADTYWPTVLGTLALKATYAYCVFRFSQVLRNHIVVTFVCCVLALFTVSYVVPFVGLLAQVELRLRSMRAARCNY